MQRSNSYDRHVICMKWGQLYGPEYVNKLFSMCSRNIEGRFEFHCMTDDSEGLDSAINLLPLPEFTDPPEPYLSRCQTWRKLILFSKRHLPLEGKILFLDLDVVIVGSIDAIFEFSDQLAIVENWYQPGRNVGQASAFCFQSGRYEKLLTQYLERPVEMCKQYRTEQAYITQQLGFNEVSFFPEFWFSSFKKHCLPGGVLNPFLTSKGFPKGSKVVVFHGHPNPPDAIAGRWGKKRPWYKAWYKSIKPAVWIKNYWR